MAASVSLQSASAITVEEDDGDIERIASDEETRSAVAQHLRKLNLSKLYTRWDNVFMDEGEGVSCIEEPYRMEHLKDFFKSREGLYHINCLVWLLCFGGNLYIESMTNHDPTSDVVQSTRKWSVDFKRPYLPVNSSDELGKDILKQAEFDLARGTDDQCHLAGTCIYMLVTQTTSSLPWIILTPVIAVSKQVLFWTAPPNWSRLGFCSQCLSEPLWQCFASVVWLATIVAFSVVLLIEYQKNFSPQILRHNRDHYTSDPRVPHTQRTAAGAFLGRAGPFLLLRPRSHAIPLPCDWRMANRHRIHHHPTPHSRIQA